MKNNLAGVLGWKEDDPYVFDGVYYRVHDGRLERSFETPLRGWGADNFIYEVDSYMLKCGAEKVENPEIFEGVCDIFAMWGMKHGKKYFLMYDRSYNHLPVGSYLRRNPRTGKLSLGKIRPGSGWDYKFDVDDIPLIEKWYGLGSFDYIEESKL